MRQDNLLRIFKALLLLTLAGAGESATDRNNPAARLCFFLLLCFFSIVLFGFDKSDRVVLPVSFFNEKRPPDDSQDKNLTLEI